MSQTTACEHQVVRLQPAKSGWDVVCVAIVRHVPIESQPVLELSNYGLKWLMPFLSGNND